MARLNAKGKLQRQKDETIDFLLSKVNSDSREQAQRTVEVYKKGQLYNWKTAKNILERFSGSDRQRLFARKRFNKMIGTWESKDVKQKKITEVQKSRDKIKVFKEVASKAIQALAERRRFR